MSNKRGRTVKRPNFIGTALLPKEERVFRSFEMLQNARKNEEDVEDIAKMLDQNVTSDEHFAEIIARVNEILERRGMR
jgi:hypothetical protein